MDVKTLCLGVLSRGEATGYEIKKICEDGPFAHFYAAGFGSIYPALNALSDEGLISMREVLQDGRPAKKVYALTAAGRLALTAALSEPPAPDRLRSDFLFMTFFGELMPARDVDRLIENRIALLRGKLADMRTCAEEVASGGPAFTLGYGIAVYEAAADYLETHRHELVAASLRNEIDGRPQGPQPALDGARPAKAGTPS